MNTPRNLEGGARGGFSFREGPENMSSFIAYTIFGLFTGAAYAIAASGLVLTYTTTRVFNIAHGAFGMVMAFLFWDFSVRQGLPTWLSLVLVLVVVAPAIGWFIQRFVARGLGDAPVSVSLVVTVACSWAASAWPRSSTSPSRPASRRSSPRRASRSASTIVTAHQLITIIASIVVAVGLYLLLNRTRIGTAMRASVDNPELLKLFGGKPDQVAALSWAIGISLAALAGILLVPPVGLDSYSLTLLVINAYAAAMLGRLKSLPLTFVGAMGLGLLESFAPGYLPHGRAARPGRQRRAGAVPVRGHRGDAAGAAADRPGQGHRLRPAALDAQGARLGGRAAGRAWRCCPARCRTPTCCCVGTAATYAMVMLSLVLLTGYGGHVSLAQFTFAGVGALAYAKLDEPNLYGLLLSALIAAGVGALVALPVLRLTGLYLALSTLAFASIMDKMVFQAEFAFGFNGTLTAERLSILGKSFTSHRRLRLRDGGVLRR